MFKWVKFNRSLKGTWVCACLNLAAEVKMKLYDLNSDARRSRLMMKIEVGEEK